MVARTNRTGVKALPVIGTGTKSMPERLFHSPSRTLFLASVFIAQTAAAQVAPIAGTTVSGAAAISVPVAKTAQARMAAKPTAARHHGDTVAATSTNSFTPSKSPTSWPVAASLKSTLRAWAQRQGWPAPQFLTQADWAVDVPGSIPGSIEDALKALTEGFGRSLSRPRIEVSANHVMIVSETGAE